MVQNQNTGKRLPFQINNSFISAKITLMLPDSRSFKQILIQEAFHNKDSKHCRYPKRHQSYPDGKSGALIILRYRYLCVELKVKCCCAGWEGCDRLVRAALGQTEPVVLAAPAGSQVGQPGIGEATSLLFTKTGEQRTK